MPLGRLLVGVGDAQDGLPRRTACPSTCKLTGKPSLNPHGTAMPGIPAMFAGIVKTSARYIWYGSSVRAPIGKATVGEVGATIASTFANASSKSRLISVRTFCALT